LVLVVRAEEELHDYMNIACSMRADVFRFVTKSGQKLFANPARDTGESPHRLFQDVEDCEWVLLVGWALAEGDNKRFIVFEGYLCEPSEARGDLATDVRVMIMAELDEALFTPSPVLRTGNVGGSDLCHSAAL
jgi:hypothetical protein